jgi:hypothetical protein
MAQIAAVARIGNTLAVFVNESNTKKMIKEIRKKHFIIWVILLVVLPALAVITWFLTYKR